MCYVPKGKDCYSVGSIFCYCTDTWRIFYSTYSMKAKVPNPNLSGETPKTNRLSYDQVPSNTLANISIKSGKSAK